MRIQRDLWVGLVAALATFLAMPAQAAGPIEMSIGFSYTRSNYDGGSYNWTRRIGGSVGYHLTELTQFEFGFQDTVDRNKIVDFEDTTFHDQIYSVSWLQNLVPKSVAFQPFTKVGIGQLNREATGHYSGGNAPARRVDSVTGVLGGGIRLYLTRTFAIRSELTSYLAGGNISKWKDNISTTIGASMYF